MVFEPRVIFKVKTEYGWLRVKFLIDSGADVTILPIRLAGLFGFDKNKSELTTIGGVEGKLMTAFPKKLDLEIDKHRFSVRSFFVETDIIPLLGRLDVWDKFSICFDNKNKVTQLEPF